MHKMAAADFVNWIAKQQKSSRTKTLNFPDLHRIHPKRKGCAGVKGYQDGLVRAKNTHRWGKDHCTVGLQFYKVALDCFTKYKQNYISFIGQFQSC